MGMTSEELSHIVKEIDVDKAECWDPRDKEMILGKIRLHHASTAAFNTALRLQLMLDPVSFKVDLMPLEKRSQGTKWRFEQVKAWLAESPAASRCCCVMAGAGTGKSTISAALWGRLLGPQSGVGGEEGPVSAAHFLKYSDQRRLEPVRIIKSLTFQLAKRSEWCRVGRESNILP